MSIETPSLLHGLSIAEKVSKLSAFIGDDLDMRSTQGIHVAGGCYLLIARSPDSPVAQAVRSHAGRLSTLGIRVRTIFSEVDSSKPAHLLAPFSVPSECRLARDPRLLAAHEQLTLTQTCTWVGDCMRRDPGKRDALERFAPNCAQTGAHAVRSFESLWRATVPVYSMPTITAALAQMPEMGCVEGIPDGMRRQ
jgi:hypothetical protein